MLKYFETIKCIDEEALNLYFHQKRVANTIAMNIDLNEYIFPPSEELLRCKVIYDESGVLSIDYYPYQKREIRSFCIVEDNDIEYSKKYLDRTSLDKLFFSKNDCDEIMIFKNNLLTDTTIANIAINIDGIWLTPKTPLLYGTTRDRLLSEKFIFESDITKDMLKSCSKVALMNAMIGFDILDSYSFKW